MNTRNYWLNLGLAAVLGGLFGGLLSPFHPSSFTLLLVGAVVGIVVGVVQPFGPSFKSDSEDPK